MPRDANGNYSLPAGNPVVSGTPISSAVTNSTNNDIAAALSDSLSRSGLGGMTAALPFADGLVGSPSITFTSELTTGIYRPAPGQLGISVLAQQIAYFAADGIYGRQPFKQWNGTSYDLLLAAGSNATITGNWAFANLITATGGVKQGTKGLHTYHNDPAFPSSAIYVSSAAPTSGDGSDGDIWLEI